MNFLNAKNLLSAINNALSILNSEDTISGTNLCCIFVPMLRYLFLLLIILGTTSGYAQSKRKKAKKAATTNTQPNSLAPSNSAASYYPKEDYETDVKKRKKANGKVTYTAREKFYERMDELEKAQRKNEKMMEKPQYSDPSYFGHKRPPKKRPPGKMKFCKECRIRH